MAEKTIEKQISVLEQKIIVEDAIIHAAEKRRTSAEDELRDAQRELWRLHELEIVKTGLPASLEKLRSRILSKRKQTESKQITIGKKETLDKEIKELVQKLQSLCPHSFLLSYDGYKGDSDRDYDNARYAQRFCTACGLREDSKSTRGDIFEVLKENLERLIKRDLRRETDLTLKSGVWQDFKFFLAMFEKSAGQMNAEW